MSVRVPAVALGAVLLVAVGLVAASCGGGAKASSGSACTTVSGHAPASTAAGAAAWPYPNGDLANARDATGSGISSANVSRLAPAWTFKLPSKAAGGATAYGALTANPIVERGSVYMQDLDSNVYALSLATGKLEWEYRCAQPERSGPGPNGVAVSGGKVYGLTPTTAFAVNAATGRKVWVDSHLLRTGQGTFGIQPQAAGGRVYLASQYGPAPGGGVLLALNAVVRRGGLEVQHGQGPGARRAVARPRRRRSVGDAARRQRRDGDVRDREPVPDGRRCDRTSGEGLYTDSDVNLDAATGKLRWYYQGVPDDFKDWDMQTSPISARADGAAVVVGSGKMGDVYEMNAGTGRLMWKTPVGAHDGHDDDSLRALEHRSTLKTPFTSLPGPLGGVLTNLAVAGNSVYVATLDLPLTYTSLAKAAPTKVAGTPTGEVEALNLATGRVEWDTEGAPAAAGRRDRLARSRLHDALRRRADRTGSHHGRDGLSPQAPHVRQLADRHRRERRHRARGRAGDEDGPRDPADRGIPAAVTALFAFP